MHIYRDHDADLTLVQQRQVAIIGYGNQAAAHAANLRDSGVSVLIGLREDSSSWQQARAQGFTVQAISEAVRRSTLVMLLIPDEAMPEVYQQHIAPYLHQHSLLGFAHGFAIHFKTITPPAHLPVLMVAPKGPGYQVRESFLQGRGLPGLVAYTETSPGSTLALALAYAKAIGCTRQGVLLTSFREETETDLFGEQAVLCGGIPSLVKAAFATLLEAGYSEEMAYIECLYEIKLIVALLEKGGLTFMRRAISNTAEFGGNKAGELLIDERVREKMRLLLQAIQNGSFAEAWMAEYHQGLRDLHQQRTFEAGLRVEQVGTRLREILL